MATATEQAKLANQVKAGQVRDNNESFSSPIGLTNIASAMKAKRNESNQYMEREPYLVDALHMMAEDFEKQGYPLPMPIRVSLSKANAKRTVADDKKPYAFNNSKTWGALVAVQKNTAGEYEVFINNEIEDTQAILASFYAALILTLVGPTHYTDADKKAKFPNGELTFKSEVYDELANKLGILGKYRGNLVSGKSDSLSRILIKIQDALGPCPITPILVDQAMKSGLKQSATNYKAVCKNQLCDALKATDSKGGTNKPFQIANISQFWADTMQNMGAKMPCPICNPHAKENGSFLALINPAEEKAKADAEKARKVLEAQEKAKSNVITLSAPTTPVAAEAPAQEQAPATTAETPAQAPVTAKPEKVNRKGRNAA